MVSFNEFKDHFINHIDVFLELFEVNFKYFLEVPYSQIFCCLDIGIENIFQHIRFVNSEYFSID